VNRGPSDRVMGVPREHRRERGADAVAGGGVSLTISDDAMGLR
jgi:hypothetical protein